MSNLKRSSEHSNPGQRDEVTSSHGDHSRSVTPKDVVPEDAAHRDVTEHKLTSKDIEEKAQAMLDEAVEESFPASDPIAVPTFEEAVEIIKSREACEEAARKNAQR
jgi:hypothetical protein